MHVCVDKNPAFSSPLNTERRPETADVQSTFHFFTFCRDNEASPSGGSWFVFFKSSIFLTLFAKTTFPCSRCKIYLDWKVLNGIWVYSHETILSSLRRMHCIRASDKCLLQIKLSPSPASWQSGPQNTALSRGLRTMYSWHPGVKAQRSQLIWRVPWTVHHPGTNGRWEETRKPVPLQTAVVSRCAQTIFWWRKSSGHNIASCLAKEFDKTMAKK